MPVEICVNLYLTVDLETGVQTIHYITVCKMWKCDIKAADFCSTLQYCNFRCLAQSLTLKV